MKKTYSKPQIVFENFSLSTNIAGDCEIKNDTQAARQCGYDMFPFEKVFLTDITGCTMKVTPEEGMFNGLCYHVPIETNNLFNS